MGNKVVFITGANGGIGLAIVEKMANEGYDIIAHTRKKTDEFEQRMQSLSRDAKVEIMTTYFDLTDRESMRSSVKDILQGKKRIDTLVNCAGVAEYRAFAMFPIDDIKKIYDINLFAPMELTQLLLRTMIKNNGGNIVNVASIAGIDTDKGNSAYGTSKAALIAWTKVLASEVAPLGIRVNAVAPGMVDTEMAKMLNDDDRKKKIGESAMNRMACPNEIANVVSFLVSDAASYINGGVIRVDGGK